jgi:phage shock protein A
MVVSLEGKIRTLKSQIAQWENELKSLEARQKVADATGKINKQLANIDSTGTLAMLEKMKQRVEEQEALSEAYGDMADTSKSVDEEINKALNDPTIKAADALADLKRKMGITPAAEEKIEIKEKSDVTIKIEVDKGNNNL